MPSRLLQSTAGLWTCGRVGRHNTPFGQSAKGSVGKGEAPGIAPECVTNLVLRSQALRVTYVCWQTLAAARFTRKILMILFVRLRNFQSIIQEILPCSASLADGQRRVKGSAVGRHVETVILLTNGGSCCRARLRLCTRSTYNLESGIPACAADSCRHLLRHRCEAKHLKSVF